jgi:long-chain acyl-CoA synthetase
LHSILLSLIIYSLREVKMRTVLNMFQKASVDFADRSYLWEKTDSGWACRNFRETADESDAFASALIRRGYKRENTVAILSEGSPRWVIGEFGILKAGCISVPLSIKLLPEELPFRLNHSEARAILVSKNNIEKLLKVYHKLESSIDIICLDNDSRFLETALREYDLAGKIDILYFDTMIAEEKEIGIDSSALQEIQNQLGEDDTVTISYTSGTTGNPKGIMLTHKNYYVNCHDSINMFNVPYDFQTLVILPCDHSFAHTVALYSALVVGISLYFVDARGGSMAILRNIPINLTEANPDFLLTVPALTGNFMKKITAGVAEKGAFVEGLFRMGMKAGKAYHGDGFTKPPFLRRAVNLLPYKIADLIVFKQIRKIFGNRIKFCVGGGALLDIKQQEFFMALGVPVYQGYGLTEAAPVISSNTREVHKLGSSGRPAPSLVCKIVDGDGKELPLGETGEIVVKGENVMKGYFKNPEATAETVVDGRLHTGDRGYMDENDFLYVVGREKALLIADDGEKYSPEEIEEAIINSSDLVSQVMIYNDHKKYTSALVVLDEQAVKDLMQSKNIRTADELLEAIHASLNRFREDPAYKDRFPSMWIPRSFQLVPEPFSEQNQMINSSMKMVRYKISEAYEYFLEYMYTPDGDSYINDENRKVIKTMFGL